MITTGQLESKLKALKPFLKENYHVEKLGYFGSYAAGSQHNESDLDILVSFSKPIGWSFIDLQDFLQEELNLEIDLVSLTGLREELKNQILQQTKFIA